MLIMYMYYHVVMLTYIISENNIITHVVCLVRCNSNVHFISFVICEFTDSIQLFCLFN